VQGDVSPVLADRRLERAGLWGGLVGGAVVCASGAYPGPRTWCPWHPDTATGTGAGTLPNPRRRCGWLLCQRAGGLGRGGDSSREPSLASALWASLQQFLHLYKRVINRVSDGVGHSCCHINICCWIMISDGCRCLSRGAGSSPQNASPPAPGYRAHLLGWTRSAHRADGALMTTSRLQFVPVLAPPRCPPPEISGSECERVAGR
jgi:hypothetical protein